MLRVLVIALVLVNAVLLAVHRMEPVRQAKVDTGAEPAAASGAPTLVLLSELDEAEEPVRGSAECFTAGPFLNEEARDAARRFIASSAISITQRQTVATIDRGTWVYLPVQPDYMTARSMALTLRDAGFADASVVRDGEWNNSVSLGYFLADRNAEFVHREARALGFPVETREQQHVEPRYWIDFEQRAGAPYVRATADGPITFERLRLIPCGDRL